MKWNPRRVLAQKKVKNKKYSNILDEIQVPQFNLIEAITQKIIWMTNS